MAMRDRRGTACCAFEQGPMARLVGLASIVALLCSAGCAAPTASHEALDIPAHGPDGDPIAMLAVHDRLGWPYSLDAVAVGVDGEAVADLSAAALADHDVVAAVALPRGEHRVTATAHARYASTPFSTDDCLVQIRHTERIYVGDAPLAVRFDVHSQARGRAFSDRLGVAVVVKERAEGSVVPGLSARSDVERELLEGPAACLGENIPDDVDPLATRP